MVTPKTSLKLIIVVAVMFFTSGCAVLGAAISAAAGYGIYQATRH